MIVVVGGGCINYYIVNMLVGDGDRLAVYVQVSGCLGAGAGLRRVCWDEEELADLM